MRMKRECDVWVCDYAECGHFWLAGSADAPEKCPKCKRRKWHRELSTVELIRSQVAAKLPVVDDERIEAIARRVFREEWEKVPVEAEPLEVFAPVPDVPAKLSELRGVIAALERKPVETLQPVQPVMQPCSFTSWNDVDGENYQCGLPAHDWKVKHGDWIKL